MNRVIVIGGGAAGMMAAYREAELGASVLLLEKNEKLGKKIYITGKGRCNLTNACDTEALFQNVVHHPKFLYSAFYGFPNTSVMELFENLGCHLKIERGERVFPVSDHASDVIRALGNALLEKGVEVWLRTPVKKLLLQGDKVLGVLLQNGKRELADAVIVATGGLSYQTTGSTGDGYGMAQAAGHSLIEVQPSLVPLVTDKEPKQLQGLSLKNVSARLLSDNGRKVLYEGFGEMLFTHFGVSGPLILSASSFYQGGSAVLQLDLKPALTQQQLDKRLLRDFEDNRNKQFKNALGGLFPSKLIPVMVQCSGIDPETPVHEITREMRQSFVRLIKSWELHITGRRGYEEAIITRGGVSTKEINPSTMESKRCGRLYFAGEVLDLDALTGGFNLQIAWSTGYLAGESAAEREEEKNESYDSN